MKLRNALLVATIAATPVAAMAEPVTGLYIGAGLGYNHMDTWDVKSVSSAFGTARGGGAQLRTAGGFVGLGSVGWGLGNGLRAELEGSYREQSTRLRRAAGLGGGGVVKTYGVMANVLYDFNVGLPVTPYVGLGGGYLWQEMQHGVIYTTSGAPGSLSLNNEAQGSFAAQAILGFAVETGVPGLAVTVEGRAVGAFSDTKFRASGAGSFPNASVRFKEQYNYSGLIGIRYAFNAPAAAVAVAPAPAAAPAPAPARTYLVFFDWDRADLTARGRQIIAEAAQASTRVQTTRIEVDGHADTSGTHRYNQGLSMRRAQAVAAELVRLGVARTAIDIKAFGDTQPLVPTGPGVREPQNRRVEIILK
ncbi:MAG TPA: OmpA family protein [Acetobacteraceae bacterium]